KLPADRDGGFAPEGHPQLAQQRLGGVVPPGGRHDRDIHAVDLVDLVVVDLREDHLLLDPHRVVAPAVEAVRRQPAEVAHARHRNRDEPVEKLVHPRTPERHAAADRHPRAQVEVRDRLLGPRHHGLLAGDGGQLRHGRFEPLGVLGRVPHPDVEHDLHELRDLVRVLQAELLRQPGAHLLRIVLVQSRRRRGLRRRPLGLRGGRFLTLGRLLALLFVLLLPPRHGRGAGGGCPVPGVLLRFLVFFVGHTTSLSREESAGRPCPPSPPPLPPPRHPPPPPPPPPPPRPPPPPA